MRKGASVSYFQPRFLLTQPTRRVFPPTAEHRYAEHTAMRQYCTVRDEQDEKDKKQDERGQKQTTGDKRKRIRGEYDSRRDTQTEHEHRRPQANSTSHRLP